MINSNINLNTESNIEITSFSTDLHLLSNRKSLELQGLSKDNYTERSTIINIERKYKVITEALEGLYALKIQHSCSLIELINSFDSI